MTGTALRPSLAQVHTNLKEIWRIFQIVQTLPIELISQKSVEIKKWNLKREFILWFYGFFEDLLLSYDITSFIILLKSPILSYKTETTRWVVDDHWHVN